MGGFRSSLSLQVRDHVAMSAYLSTKTNLKQSVEDDRHDAFWHPSA
jgi:hypothetical protein